MVNDGHAPRQISMDFPVLGGSYSADGGGAKKREDFSCRNFMRHLLFVCVSVCVCACVCVHVCVCMCVCADVCGKEVKFL